MLDNLPVLHILFYIFSVTAIGSGIMVVTASNPVRGVLSLVLTFFAMAGVWLLLHAEFLALVLVLVYVGAVMTLFLFVVMMMNVETIKFRESFVRYLPFGLMIVLLVVCITVMVLGPKQYGLEQMPVPAAEAADFSNTADLGMVLYTQYALPFIISGVLLLTAIVAAINLTHRVSKRRKSQIPSQQIAVKAKDRMRLVDITSGDK